MVEKSSMIKWTIIKGRRVLKEKTSICESCEKRFYKEYGKHDKFCSEKCRINQRVLEFQREESKTVKGIFLQDGMRMEVKSIIIQNLRTLKTIGNEVAIKILNELSESPSCAVDLSKKLEIHWQKIHYHIRNLEKAGIIKLMRTEMRSGGTAKIYTTVCPTALINFGNSVFEETDVPLLEIGDETIIGFDEERIENALEIGLFKSNRSLFPVFPISAKGREK